MMPPLAATMGKAEAEHAAALIVRACQVNGDAWQPCTWAQIKAAVQADVDSKTAPFDNLIHNPFFRPDVYDLVARGFARWTEPQVVELTAAGLAKLTTWVKKEGA